MAIFVPLWVLETTLIGLVNAWNNNTSAYAHNFSPNSLSILVSLAIEAEVELSLANSNFPSNIILALDHSKNAAKLIDDAYYFDEDIVDDADFIRKYNEALNTHNSTIHALVLANIVDQILKEYDEAFDIGLDLTNMSNMMRAPNMTSSFPSYSMNMPMNSNIEAEENDNYTNIVNIDNYQSAQKLSEKVFQVFKNQLRPLAVSSNDANQAAIIMVEKSLFDLKYLINNKASAQDIMGLVHGKLHPSLQLAYDLKLKQ
jgi:DNA-binding protein Fis